MAALGWLLNLDFAGGAAAVETGAGPLDRPMRRVAATLINRAWGDPITLTSVTPGTYATATGTATESTSTTTVSAIVAPYITDERRDFASRSDLRVTIPASAVTTAPQVRDRLTISGTEYHVVSVRSLYVNWQVATYDLRVRK